MLRAMRGWGAQAGASILLAALASGCGGGSTPPAANAPSAAPSASATPRAEFDVAVLVDADGRQPAREEIERAFAKADAKLRQKTGEGINLTEVAFAVPRGPSVTTMATTFLAARAARPPEGLLLLLNDATSTSFGGYSVTVQPPFPFVNQFPSPVQSVGAGRVYVAVMHFDHFYARCGYDGQQRRVSDVSFGGECRGRNGLPCVLKPGGEYWTCPDVLEDAYSDWDYYKGCTIVHELIHPFGTEGNLDHYGTPQCIARGGVTQAQAGDTRMAQDNCVMCPDLYPRFKRSP